MFKLKINKENGISIISLVVTVIVLLILAGISVMMITGNNGIIKHSGDAKDQTEIAREKEILKHSTLVAMDKSKFGNVEKPNVDAELASYSEVEGTEEIDEGIQVTFKSGRAYLIDTDGNVTKITVIPTVTTPPTVAVSEKTKYKDTNNDIAIIPSGFRVSDKPNEQTIETGLVVYDGNDNEWVWIPVSDTNDMITTENSPYALCGNTGISTKMTSKNILSGQRRTKTGITGSREPDLIVGSGSSYDAGTSIRKAGFTSSQDMAEKMVNDYEAMILSIKTYKGFYIGRYELTGSESNPREVSGIGFRENWYRLYKACKSFSVDEVVESTMIWGCQWDMACIYIANRGEKKSITDSSNWGNYVNSATPANAPEYWTYHELKETGSCEYWCANNIFDLAGNDSEWTQEANEKNSRMLRGGGCNEYGNGTPVSFWGAAYYADSGHYGSRPTLYIK